MNTKKLIVAALLAAGAGAVHAYPRLQVGIVDGFYDDSTQTTVASTTPFTAYALLTPHANDDVNALLGATYRMSFALTPNPTSGSSPDFSLDLGSFTVDDGNNPIRTVNVTTDMFYGTPPIESIAQLQPSDSSGGGDLAPHGIFDTYFVEVEFQFNPLLTTKTFNVAPSGTPNVDPTDDSCLGCDPGTGALVGTGSYYAKFEVDVAALEASSSIHLDLYDTAILNDITCTMDHSTRPPTQICTATTDIDINQFAPFSHDAQSDFGGGAGPGPVSGVPEIDAVAGTGALTLLAGAMALAGERRRRKTS